MFDPPIISKNRLCEHISSNVSVDFDDSKSTVRYEPVRPTKVL